jgi:hypothetical protein
VSEFLVIGVLSCSGGAGLSLLTNTSVESDRAESSLEDDDEDEVDDEDVDDDVD